MESFSEGLLHVFLALSLSFSTEQRSGGGLSNGGRRGISELFPAQHAEDRDLDRSLKLHVAAMSVGLQWNLRTRDTLGLIVLSLVERLSLSRR